VEARQSYEHFEHGHQVGAGELGHHGRSAAMAVAVMAAFLALAAFLANEAVKHVITEETQRADTSARLESNLVRIDIAEGNSTMLRVLGAGSPKEHVAAAEAARHEARVVHELKPVDAHLEEQIQDHIHETDHADSQHVIYELAGVGLQVGIVLASVSIIARRRWLLGVAGAAASAGVAMLLIGLVVV
jgi:hypothetical protein